MNRDIPFSAEPAASPAIDTLSAQHAQALVRVIERAAEVRRRYQFFVWSQSYLSTLVPHKLAVCGSYMRSRKDLVFEAFNSIPVPGPLLAAVTDSGSAMMQQIIGAWIDRRGKSLVLDVNSLGGLAAGNERDQFLASGYAELLVHGVSRPQRPSELESLFILGAPNGRCTPQMQMYIELVLPHVHTSWLRVQATERELAGTNHNGAAPRVDNVRMLITDRENQILFWVREGKSNQEIGDQLGISVLTVKNHVQKILRKLGAANRAQAVAKAMTLNLIGRDTAGDVAEPGRG